MTSGSASPPGHRVTGITIARGRARRAITRRPAITLRGGITRHLAGIIIGRGRYIVLRPRCITVITRVTTGVIAGSR